MRRQSEANLAAAKKQWCGSVVSADPLITYRPTDKDDFIRTLWW